MLLGDEGGIVAIWRVVDGGQFSSSYQCGQRVNVFSSVGNVETGIMLWDDLLHLLAEFDRFDPCLTLIDLLSEQVGPIFASLGFPELGRHEPVIGTPHLHDV